MVGLKDKTWEVRTIDVGKDFYCPKDVKEVILKYKEYLRDLETIGVLISKEEFISKWGKSNYIEQFDKIFGDFEK